MSGNTLSAAADRKSRWRFIIPAATAAVLLIALAFWAWVSFSLRLHGQTAVQLLVEQVRKQPESPDKEAAGGSKLFAYPSGNERQSDRDVDRVRKAARHVKKLGLGEQAAGELARLFADKDSYRWPLLVAACQELGDVAAPSLIDALSDATTADRATSVLLRMLDRPGVMATINEAIRHDSRPAVCVSLLRVLANVANQHLSSDEDRARVEKIVRLMDHALLAKCLHNGDFGIRFNAARVLVALDPKEARVCLPVLFSAMDPQNFPQWFEAVLMIAEVDPTQYSRVAPYVEKLLVEGSPQIRCDAATAIREFSRNAESAIPLLTERFWIERKHVGIPRVDLWVLDALGHVGSATGDLDVERLICQLVQKDSDELVRRWPMHWLGEYGTPASLGALCAALTDDSVEVRREAASTLMHMESAPQSAAPALRKALSDKDEDVRGGAAEALRRMKTLATGK